MIYADKSLFKLVKSMTSNPNDVIKALLVIKLKDLLSEESNHPVYGSHKTNFLVTRPFDVFIKTGRLKPTVNVLTPLDRGSKEMFRDVGKKVKVKKECRLVIYASGIFLIDRKRKKLLKLSIKKAEHRKLFTKGGLSDIENYVDYVTWKNC